MDALFDSDNGLPTEMQLAILSRLEGVHLSRLIRLAQAHHNVLVKRGQGAQQVSATTERSIRTLKRLCGLLLQKISATNARFAALARLPSGQLQAPMRAALEQQENGLQWFDAHPNAATVDSDTAARSLSRWRPPPLRPFSVKLTLSEMLTMYRALTLVAGIDADPNLKPHKRLEEAMTYLLARGARPGTGTELQETLLWLATRALLDPALTSAATGEQLLLTDWKLTRQWTKTAQRVLTDAMQWALPYSFKACLEQLEAVRDGPRNAPQTASDLRFLMRDFLDTVTAETLDRAVSAVLAPEARAAWDGRFAALIHVLENTDVVEFIKDLDGFFAPKSRGGPAARRRSETAGRAPYEDLAPLNHPIYGAFIDNFMAPLIRLGAVHSLDALAEWFTVAQRATVDHARPTLNPQNIYAYMPSATVPVMLHYDLAHASAAVFQWFTNFRLPGLAPLLERRRALPNDGILLLAPYLSEKVVAGPGAASRARPQADPWGGIDADFERRGFARVTDEATKRRLIRLADSTSDEVTYRDLERVRFFDDALAVEAVFRSLWVDPNEDTRGNMHLMLRSTAMSTEYVVARVTDGSANVEWRVYERQYNAITRCLDNVKSGMSRWIGTRIIRAARDATTRAAFLTMLREMLAYDRRSVPNGFVDRVAVFDGFLDASAEADADENLADSMGILRLLFQYIPTRPDPASRQLSLDSREGRELLRRLVGTNVPQELFEAMLDWQDMTTDGGGGDSDSDELEATRPRIDLHGDGLGAQIVLYAVEQRYARLLKRLREWTDGGPIELTDALQRAVIATALKQRVIGADILEPSAEILNELRQWRYATPTPLRGRLAQADLPDDIGFAPYHHIGDRTALPRSASEARRILDTWEREYTQRAKASLPQQTSKGKTKPESSVEDSDDDDDTVEL
jgi:hypothetical protein